MFVDEMLVLDQFVLHLLLQVGTFGTQVRQAIHHIQHQMETVEFVLHSHVKGRCDRTFFYIAAHMKISVGAAVRQPVDQPGVPVKGKYDVLVFSEQRIVVLFAESVRVLAR